MPTGTQNAANAVQPNASAPTFADLPTLEDSNPKPAPQIQPAPQIEEPAEELPDKFKGKSAAEIAKSYVALEQRLGTQSQELGTLRSSVDQLLELKRTEDLTNNGVSPEIAEISTDDVLTDPRTAISTVANEAVAPVQNEIAQLRGELSMRDFRDRHPTFEEDQHNANFQAFVQGSAYRTNLAAKLHQSAQAGNPDVGVAEELWSAWDEHKAASEGASNTELKEVNNTGSVQDAALVGRDAVATDSNAKPVYSRAAIAAIAANDRARYESPAFQKAITEAFKEGRVK